MKITIESPQPGAQDEIIIRCAALDDDLLNLIYALKMGRDKLSGYSEKGMTMLSIQDIYYFESVDNRVFAYCEKEVYEVRRKLYELEAEYAYTDFLRASKSTIVNISKIARLTSAFNGRLEARLKNGEKTIISRQYVPELKKKLGIER